MIKSNTWHYLVHPFDVLFFRKNKPFDFGDWYSEGFFPPLPSTFQGFIRTSILMKHHQLQGGRLSPDAAKLVGDDQQFPLDISGPFLFTVQQKNWYFPTPRDVVVDRNGGTTITGGRQIRLSPDSIACDLGSLHYPDEKEKAEYLWYSGAFLSDDQINQYRKQGTFSWNNCNPVYHEEEHYGIQLKKNKSIEEHRFYLTPYKRLGKEVAFYFKLESEKSYLDLTGQYSRLGSEGRGAIIEKTDQQLNLTLDDSFYEELAQSKKCKFIFLQPAILPPEFLPFQEAGHAESLSFKPINWNGLQLKPIYATMGERLKIGGISFIRITTNPHNSKTNYGLKPMVNALPAGSVFYFHIENADNIQNLAETLQQLDGGKVPFENYHKMGYNQFVLGKISD